MTSVIALTPINTNKLNKINFCKVNPKVRKVCKIPKKLLDKDMGLRGK